MSVLALGLTAGTLGLLRLVPQIARLLRTRNASGLSSASLALGIAQCMLWLTYGLTSGDVAQVVTNVGALSLAALQTVLVLLIRRGRRRTATLLMISSGTAIAASVLAATAPWSVGMLAAVIGITAALPQVVVAARGDDLSGLSLASWLMTMAAASLWLLYAVLSSQPFVFAASIVAVGAAAVVAWRVHEQHRLVRHFEHMVARSYYSLAA